MKGFKKSLLTIGLFLSFSSFCFSQQYTLRDQAEIAYQAELTLNMYKDLLNVIAYEGLASESEIKELIRNSYSNSPARIFYSDAAIIEDNIKPSNLSSKHEQDKTIKEYLHYFDLTYVKSDQEAVDFYDIQTSNVKYGQYLYIKVKYTAHFKGKHKEDPAAYKAVDRLAELRVEKGDQEWKTYITSIVFYDPKKPVQSTEGDVVLDKSVADDGTFAHLRGQINRPVGNSAGGAGQTYGQTQEQDSVFNTYLQTGKAALVAENLDEAFVAFSEAEKIYPLHQELRKNLMELAKAQNLQISSAANRFEFYKRSAEKAQAAREYGKAKTLFSEALRLKPDEGTIKVSIEKLDRIIQKTALLESKYAVGEYKEAIKEYTKAIKREDNNPDYYLGRGKAFEKLEAYKEALKDYSKAIELDRNFIEALSSRAALYTEIEQYHEAVADYSLIISNPDYAARFYPKRARVKEILGDFAGALEDYNSAIQLNPRVADHDYRKGLIYLNRKEPEQAVNFFNQALYKDPQYPGVFFHRGLGYVELNNISAAAADFEKAREQGLEQAQLNRIQQFSLQLYTKGEGEMEKDRFQDALKTFEEALLITPAFGRAWLRKGDALYELQQYDNAIINYDQAVELDSLSYAYFRRGLAHQQKGDSFSAREDFNRYIPIGREVVLSAEKASKKNLNPEISTHFPKEPADALYALGYAYLMTEQPGEALKNIDMAIDARKFFPKAYFARGSALFALGDYKRAVKNMEESIKQGLSDPAVFNALGKAYVANEQLKDAVLSYSHTLKLDPEYVDAYLGRALTYKQLKDYESALEDIYAVLRLNKDLEVEEKVAVLTNKGMLELYQNKSDEAHQSFDQALLLDGNDGWALYGKACALASDDKLEESLEWYMKAFETKEIKWTAIKKDPLLSPVSSRKEFIKLVKTYL